MAGQFYKVEAENVFGWEFDGTKPDDEFILRMARIGVVVDYTSNEDNDHEGSILELLQVNTDVSRSVSPVPVKRFMYYKRDETTHHSKKTVLWTEGASGGRIIEEWDLGQRIQWSRAEEE